MREKRIMRGYRAMLCSISDSDNHNTQNNSSGRLTDLVGHGQVVRHHLLSSKYCPKVYLTPTEYAAHSETTTSIATVTDNIAYKGVEKEVVGLRQESKTNDIYKEAISECERGTPHVAHNFHTWTKILPSLLDTYTYRNQPSEQLLLNWLHNAKNQIYNNYYTNTINQSIYTFDELLNKTLIGFQQVDMVLHTGRTHQLRGQLSNLPLSFNDNNTINSKVTAHIAGDSMYVGPSSPVLTADENQLNYRDSPYLGLQSYKQSFPKELYNILTTWDSQAKTNDLFISHGSYHDEVGFDNEMVFHLRETNTNPWWPMARYLQAAQ